MVPEVRSSLCLATLAAVRLVSRCSRGRRYLLLRVRSILHKSHRTVSGCWSGEAEVTVACVFLEFDAAMQVSHSTLAVYHGLNQAVYRPPYHRVPPTLRELRLLAGCGVALSLPVTH